MIDIYDEIGYIKNVLRDGFSEKWERDATLLIRYLKSEGYKKKDVKEKIREKCEDANRAKKISYNHDVSYKRFNSIFEKAWKNKTDLRQIKSVEISKEVLDWFLNLENIEFSDEEVAYYKIRRPHISIKNNKPFNFQRIKYLFTLYIWTKIQENYLERPWVHYIKQYSKKFKTDANLNQSFSLNNERDFLYDLGYIHVNFKLGIDAKFIRENDVFSIPITDENRIEIKSDEALEGDLYNPGYWLEKQKYGSFVCQNCGKEFVNYNKNKKGRPRKYCKECSDLIENKVLLIDKKEIKCEDCGKIFLIDKSNKRTKRCDDCQDKRDKEFAKKYMKKIRENIEC